ncbi:DUF4419 domain-containing protein [Aspergillus candidus]|uniref:DUF4419 domain-containing protein n=1 Tax=Aspergillus candidus TaxID=41067 RepID=A0A2I2F5S4_ASPCN|nr:hypothetical protein BDW47DRAFT_109306 [Aspergillus candidus]PLB36002.1 hypothetical protein BDW47DRAFT_109306 [Aspergillus candidus]
MPVTLTTAEHSPRRWKATKVSSAEELLKGSSPKNYRRSRKLIQNSFSQSLLDTSHVSASNHGFVWAVFHAYSDHHHLTLRPEDVWFSILTQLGFFVNAHAEELRSFFVAHEGQKELKVYDVGTVETVDFGRMALYMTSLIEKNVVDEDLRNWIMPDFSTTTESDKVVGAILMMGALQKYFSYTMSTLCGIPSVTLLGEREDWARMVTKLDKLRQLGDEPARFAQLLRPVLNHFVASFDRPDAPDVLTFWSKCAHEESMGSGPDYLTGWITVFCFWDEDGKLLHRENIHSSSSREFESGETEFGLDDALSRHVDTGDVPSGHASVPVTVDDNGTVYDTVMLAGLVGIEATSSGAMLDGTNNHAHSGVYLETRPYHPSAPTERADLNSIQPLSGWWMYEKERAEDAENRTREVQKIDNEISALDPRDDTSRRERLRLYTRLEELRAF